jgi:hypothetical protein
MKEWIVRAPVQIASGYQSFIVKAKSSEEAIEAWRNGEGEFESEEISVESYGTPSVEENV